MESEIGESAMVVALFANLMEQYTQYRAVQRHRKLRRRRQMVVNRPSSYGLYGYNSHIFKAVMQKEEEIVHNHSRLSVRALEKVVDYSTVFISCTKGWKKHFYVAVFLYWLGCGASYRVTGASFNISRFTVRDIVHECLNGFFKLLPTVIKYPSADLFAEIGQKFNRHIFQNAVGAIDGSHVRIAVPTGLRDQYINRKGFSSLQLQTVCSSSGEFFSICTGYPGSVHDERVLKSSNLYKDHNFPPTGYYLLGDTGYKCRLQPVPIITPYKRIHHLTDNETRFNRLHSKARSIIESAFGMMKVRWRSLLDKVLSLNICNCTKTIAVACLMHNICLNDGFVSESDVEDDNNSTPLENEEHAEVDEDNAAIAFRASLTQNI